MDPDTATAANLAENLAEFDTSANSDTPQSSMDDFMSAFQDIGKTSDTDDTEPDVTKTDAGNADSTKDTTPDVDDSDPDNFPDMPPGKGSQASKDGWNKLKATAKDFKTKFETAEKTRAEELAARDAELETLRKQVANLPELSERAKLADEAEKELAISRVEGTREYKETIEAPLIAIEDAAEAIAKANNVNFDDILDALTERDVTKRRELLEDLMTGLRDTDKFDIIQMAKDTQQILTKRDNIRSRAAEARKELEAITQANETKAQKKAREDFESATAHSVSELRKRVPFIAINEGETADSVFNAILAKAKESNLDTANAATKAFSATAGVLLPRVTLQLIHVQEENRKLQARIQASNASSPKVGSTQQTSGFQEDDDDDFTDVTGKFLGVKTGGYQLE